MGTYIAAISIMLGCLVTLIGGYLITGKNFWKYLNGLPVEGDVMSKEEYNETMQELKKMEVISENKSKLGNLLCYLGIAIFILGLIAGMIYTQYYE